MIFMLVISPFGFMSSRSLYGSQFLVGRTLGFTLFVEITGVLLITIVGYLTACLRYYGHLEF